MVSAHTSVEKMNVALYAVARSLRNQKRVIYTNPIKALCKQKYREFKKKFSDVGLMTGDLTIDPNASCLVTTTDIWHSILYKGSEVMREVAWIIFDEVTYMCDKERGVSWEEIIIMAPRNSHFVFLSAVVPNAKEFANWVAEVRRRPCHIVYTDHRPIPLQHYVFPFRGDDLYLVVDERGKFLERSFQKALNSLILAGEGDNKREKRESSKGFWLVRHEENNIFKMVKLIIQRQYIPAIILSFSKRDCEFLAKQMAGMDLNDDDEKANVETIIWQTKDMLSDDDKKLPQVAYMLSLLKRGFGVHHSDMLPILKEVTEILFQGGLIKCLFATETSSRGLNMPAKTVVFTNVRKFDGDKIRWISNGEYLQMSGCAGCRGIDQHGICILMIDEKMEPSTAKMMMKGSADCLNSGFHVSYNMLLNQMRCEDGDPENLLRKSFYQFRVYHALPDLEKQAKHLEAERDSIVIDGEEKLKDLYDRLQLYNSLKKYVRDIVYSPEYCLPFLLPGTPVCVQCTSDDQKPSFSIEDNVTWGVLVDFFESPKDQGEDKRSEDSDYTVNVLTRCMINNKMGAKKSMKIVPLNEHGEPVVVSLPLSKIISMSFLMLFLPDDLSPLKARENTLDRLSSFVSSFNEHGLPLLDPEDDLKVQSSLYEDSVKSIKMLESSFEKDGIKNSPLIQQKLKKIP